ncbi:hypothetical protein [Methanobrevibacter boviskoreani]|uniref:hypothetical protein n=1 Tax=Methanobrevibacter boviskoreani TaxID=1348249 RepID=UPI0023A7E5E5|nr:hypothetical protein [Methanobrevibacter boviskoreani]
MNRPVMSEPAILIMRVTLNLYGKLSWTLRAGTIEGNNFIPSFLLSFTNIEFYLCVDKFNKVQADELKFCVVVSDNIKLSMFLS